MQSAELEIAATIRGKPVRLHRLVQDGVLVRSMIQTPKGKRYDLGLNAAHPLYREL